MAQVPLQATFADCWNQRAMHGGTGMWVTRDLDPSWAGYICRWLYEAILIIRSRDVSASESDMLRLSDYPWVIVNATQALQPKQVMPRDKRASQCWTTRLDPCANKVTMQKVAINRIMITYHLINWRPFVTEAKNRRLLVSLFLEVRQKIVFKRWKKTETGLG
jgi:hypothetical protein